MSRTFNATVLRVCGCEGFEADVDLGFGVRLRKTIRMRRRAVNYSYETKGQEANHCLVVLTGGKEVVLSDAREEARWVVADVFVTAPTAMLPQVAVPGVAGQYVDVHAAMCWAEAQGWEARRLREALRP